MKRVEIKTIHSPYTLISAIIVYIIGTFILPMYKLSSFIILIILSVIVYFVLKKLNIFKDQPIEVEIPVSYESSQVEEIVTLGKSQIKTLKELVHKVDNPDIKQDIESIIQTSQAIIELIEEHQDVAKKTKKYFKYYLAEMINIVKSYDELEDNSLDVESIVESRKKIALTIHNAAISFVEYYDDLMAGKMIDIDVDLKVFDEMLDKMN